ncbi:PHP domain-containing protein, partial [Seleniivibrio woodruffii]
MIDLHCHSTYSDGTFSPSKLLEYAEKRGVEVLALTDHDTVD